MFDLPELLCPLRPAHLRPFDNFMSVCAAVILVSTASLQAAAPIHATPVLAPAQVLLDGVDQRKHALVREQLFPGGMATFNLEKRRHKEEQERAASRDDGIARGGMDSLYFDYQIKGSDHDPSIRPLRVMDDGVKTYFVMGPFAEHRKLPTLLFMAAGGATSSAAHTSGGTIGHGPES